MCFYLRSVSEESWQRTFNITKKFLWKIGLHQTASLYQNQLSILLPLCREQFSYSWMCYNSGGLVPPQQLQLCEPQDIATLPYEITIAIVIVRYFSKTNLELKMLVTI